MRRLMEWADKGDEPLRSYSIGLLAGAMDIQDTAAKFKDFNAQLVSSDTDGIVV